MRKNAKRLESGASSRLKVFSELLTWPGTESFVVLSSLFDKQLLSFESGEARPKDTMTAHV